MALTFLALGSTLQAQGLPPTRTLTEGPYYKAGSPERTRLAPPGSQGITITGTVFDLDGRPIAGAWLDFWQADGNGRYDNQGFGFRGHQFTDGQGRFTLETVVPAEYPGRTPHIHVKLRAPGGRTITSQIFFPGKAGNRTDSIFDESLVVTVAADGTTARFDFVIPR